MIQPSKPATQRRALVSIKCVFLFALALVSMFVLFHPVVVFRGGLPQRIDASGEDNIVFDDKEGSLLDGREPLDPGQADQLKNSTFFTQNPDERDNLAGPNLSSEAKKKNQVGPTRREKNPETPQDMMNISTIRNVTYNPIYGDWSDLYSVQLQTPIEARELYGLSKLIPKSGSCILDCSSKSPITMYTSFRKQQKRRLGPQDSKGRYAMQCSYKRRGFSERVSLPGWVSSDGWFECPPPPQADCTGHSTNRWDIKLNFTSSRTSYHVYYPARTEQRPFQIASLHRYTPISSIHSPMEMTLSNKNGKLQDIQVYKTKLLQVVSFFLPSETHGNECNVLWCRLKSPKGTIYTVRSFLGDVSFTFCPIPSKITPGRMREWHISLAYHADFVTPWASIVPATPVVVPNISYMTICTIVKNEGHYIHEWIEYHRMIGVDRFILYDNNADENGDFAHDLVMEKVMGLYKDQITRIPWIYRHGQTEALTDCILRFGNTTKWMGFIDVDEFFVPLSKTSTTPLHDILRQHEANPITLNAKWFVFGPCGDSLPSPNALTMEYCSSTQKNPEVTHKPIFYSQDSVGVRAFGPHYIRMRKDVGKKGHSPSTDISKLLLVYHYRYRTWPEFRDKRIGDTAGRILHRSEKDVKDMWDDGLKEPIVVEPNQNHILRFAPELHQRLEKVGWIR